MADLGLCFFCIFLCFSLMFELKWKTEYRIKRKQYALERCLDNACEASMEAERGRNGMETVNAKRVRKRFFECLAAGFDIHGDIRNQRKIKESLSLMVIWTEGTVHLFYYKPVRSGEDEVILEECEELIPYEISGEPVDQKERILERMREYGKSGVPVEKREEASMLFFSVLEQKNGEESKKEGIFVLYEDCSQVPLITAAGYQ